MKNKKSISLTFGIIALVGSNLYGQFSNPVATTIPNAMGGNMNKQISTLQDNTNSSNTLINGYVNGVLCIGTNDQTTGIGLQGPISSSSANKFGIAVNGEIRSATNIHGITMYSGQNKHRYGLKWGEQGQVGGDHLAFTNREVNGDLLLQTSGTSGGSSGERTRVRITSDGNVGVGTNINPLVGFHTNTDLRFQNLDSLSLANQILCQTANGDVYWRPDTDFSGGNSFTNLCQTQNFVTRTDANGDLVCSDIYNDPVQSFVGINQTSPESMLHIGGSGVGPLKGSPELIVSGSVYSLVESNEYTVAEFRSNETQGSSVGIRIRGSRNTRSQLDNARIDFANFDDNETDTTLMEYNMARISADMDADAQGAGLAGTGALRFYTSNAEGLEQRMFLSRLGNLGVGPKSTFDNVVGLAPLYRLHVDGKVGINVVDSDESQEKILVWDDATHEVLYRDASGLGINNNCTSTDFVPHVVSSNGDLDCGLLRDNGSAVSINGTILTSAVIPGSGTQNLKFTVYGNSFASGSQWYASDKRFKSDINTLENALDKVLEIEGVSYEFKTEEYPEMNFKTGTSIGFIAQDLEEIIPEMVADMENGYKGVEYNALIPYLVEAIKEQQIMIDELKSSINEPSNLNSNTGINSSLGVDWGLEQNIPNPFSDQTVIRFTLPDTYSQAKIIVFDMNGRTILSKDLERVKKGEVSILGSELENGMYLYSLVIDGKEVDTKRMILSN